MKSNLSELASQAHAYRQSARNNNSMRYPGDFKKAVAQLLTSGTSLALANHALEIPISTLHSWKRGKGRSTKTKTKTKTRSSGLGPVFAELVTPPTKERSSHRSYLKLSLSCPKGRRMDCEIESDESASELVGNLVCQFMGGSKR